MKHLTALGVGSQLVREGWVGLWVEVLVQHPVT